MLELIAERKGAGTPDVSVLMPVFETESLVAGALGSVLAQEGCIAEVIISDDASADGTLAAVRECVDAYHGPHTIRVFHTRRRLRIDHLGALVAVASCRILVQAHGDDVSLPGRLALLLGIHRQTGAALVTSRALSRLPDGIVDEAEPFAITLGWLALETIIGTQPGVLGGARYSIDRAVFDVFPPLTSEYLTIGHDVVQPFRAALLGGVWYTDERLIVRERHDGQWSNWLWDSRSPATHRFGFLMNRLGAMRAMSRDLDHAAATNLVAPERLAAARTILERLRAGVLDDLMEQRETLRRGGRDILWVSEDELAKANRAGKF